MDTLTLSNPLIAGVALLFEAWASKYFGFDAGCAGSMVTNEAAVVEHSDAFHKSPSRS